MISRSSAGLLNREQQPGDHHWEVSRMRFRCVPFRSREIFSDVHGASTVVKNEPMNKLRKHVLVSLTCRGAVGLQAINASVSYKDGVL